MVFVHNYSIALSFRINVQKTFVRESPASLLWDSETALDESSSADRTGKTPGISQFQNPTYSTINTNHRLSGAVDKIFHAAKP